ncbi:hypothetical protein [Aliarcobacter butzleri]|uniref:hypothetical protein n=1 Tax=Aliarcobacter butzleri TaxID=28197 RepID=UPI00189E068F|nr:hypothetical protein [Aliarcobacter butzleri]MBF7071362.1 hypothetical protein [Aliarcobacter butzleri]
MKIKKIELRNFKFHEKLDIEINKKNYLLYGENGTGKSSIYWGIYSLFTTYFRNSAFDFEKFKKHLSNEGINLNIIIEDNISLKIPNTSYSLPSTININNKNTIYFANHNFLDSFINSSSDFYKLIKEELGNHFSKLYNFSFEIENINININETNYSEQNELRKSNIEDFIRYLNKLQLRSNDIITNYFYEDFLIEFNYDWGISNALDDYKFSAPKINIIINNLNNLKYNFNEAKLKLASIAIFFALIKIEEEPENSLKLLVLDDFLSSLDMANRHYIIEYIFTEYEEYQIIILSHNLQFYNLIINWINTKNKSKLWTIENIYLRTRENKNESVIYANTSNYLTEAKNKLETNELAICGNLIRKEFEKNIHELEKILNLGIKQDTDKILQLIINNKPTYLAQNNLLEEIKKIISHCKDLSNDYDNKKVQLTSKINEVHDKLKNSYNQDNGFLNSILNNLVFYRKILLNKSSHDNPDAEIYQKEYKHCISLLEELDSFLKELKK